MDVYARPFVPQILKTINQIPANVIPSAPPRWIDYHQYTSKFAGSDFASLPILETQQQDLTKSEGLGGTTFNSGESYGNHTDTNDSDLQNLQSRFANPSTVATEQRHPSRTDRSHGEPTSSRKPSQDHVGDHMGLEPLNYSAYFNRALDQELAAQQRECDDQALYRHPVLSNRPSDRRQNMYRLHMPGLREMSLRVEISDVVKLRQLRLAKTGEIVLPPSFTDASGNPLNFTRQSENQYNATIWGIDRRNEIFTLRIDRLSHTSMLFNVSFTVQSHRMEMLRLGVSIATDALAKGFDDCWMRSMLFPEDTDGYYQKTLNRAMINLNLYDKLLNYEQLRAVNTALNERYGPVPFIISGPPGTGKTKTIVELALQLISRNKSERLLLCAPSDPAADTLVRRLGIHLGPSKLLRINSPSRSFPEVSGDILPYCHVDDGMFSLPPFKHVMNCKIVVTTCRDAGVLVNARLTNSALNALEKELHSTIHAGQIPENLDLHWTGLLIDEAAQATEPEALIPISVVAPPTNYKKDDQWPLIVMAGDQHQLSPRTACKTKAMQTSLFERLLNRPFYRDHPLARSQQTGGVMPPLTQEMLPIIRPAFASLIRNYRSHPAILATPSSLFYNDTLEPEATQTESLLGFSGWEHSGWPVLFKCNDGADEIEHDGGGWYNVSEANMACSYAQSLLQSGLLQQQEICIMSPFQAQVKVLRECARRQSMGMVNIGPLEAFQGLESRVVILCTTRTRDRFIDQDIAKGLGVIHEPKRFNVALTRAKEGLIVIGNPEVLKQDENWRAFMAFCARNQLVDGAALDINFGSGGAISRLEKQLLHRDAMGNASGDGIQDLANGFRKLGFHEHADDAMWKSGVAMEATMKEYQGEEEEDHASSNWWNA